ncbi:MAG: poly(3-hydroxyalkanoate) depolymerase [Ottowia sp.]|nr:MAG: poly(3-hydroxyalkanoate) depolymerase [Ottowia sp.]
MASAAGRVPEWRTVTLGRQQLRVARWPGDARATPLLFFNGIGASLELLSPLAQALPGTPIIAFDIPGVGLSPARWLPYRLWNMARLAGRLLDHLGIGRVDVLGVSWGGTLAQQFVLQNPRRCRRLVLAATAQGAWMVPGRLKVLRHFISPRRHNDAAHRECIAGEIYGGRARTDPQLMKSLHDCIKPTSRYGYLLQQLAVAGWCSVPWLPLLRQPTLILAGNDDPVVPLINARLMHKLIRRAHLHVFDDGHLFILSQPEATASVLQQFLRAGTAHG